MKKCIAILLTAAVCLSLTACGGEAEQTTMVITTAEPSDAAEETTAEAEEILTDEELEKRLLVWGEVDNALSAWLESANERGLTLEEKKTEAYELLVDLARNGTENAPFSLIVEHTICFNNTTPAGYSFSYTCGGGGGVMLEPFPEGVN